MPIPSSRNGSTSCSVVKGTLQAMHSPYAPARPRMMTSTASKPSMMRPSHALSGRPRKSCAKTIMTTKAMMKSEMSLDTRLLSPSSMAES